MSRLIKRLLCSLLFISGAGSASGMVKLPPLLSDHMVIQQFSWVTLWGKADQGEDISVKTGWDGKSYSLKADRNGNWKVRFYTGGPGGPYLIGITGKNKLEIKDVMVGEVWVCSGQSNMEFSFHDLGGWKYFSSLKQKLDTADLSRIRLCTIQKHISKHPSDSCSAMWMPSDTSSVLLSSATAYYFGLELYERFKVPIGLIISAWGGTPAESWTPDEYLKYTPGLQYYLGHPNDPGSEATAPSVLFNGMINPIHNYAIKGFIWYQGESNRFDCDLYGTLFTSMIRSWRKYWGLADLPFYFVQIAPFDYSDSHEASGFLREAQEKALGLDFTGMVVTLDIGDNSDIHPKNKQEVGRRLALLAFEGAYNQPSAGYNSSPEYRFSRKEGERIQVYFKNSDLLVSKGDKLTGFRIAGSDALFRPANAMIMGSSVMVWNSLISSPRYVRYAFQNTDTASVFDVNGLPAASFRTDSLPVNYRGVSIYASFNKSKKNWSVAMNCPDRNAVIRYSLNDSIPLISSDIYTDTLRPDSSCRIAANAYLKDIPSQSTSYINLHHHFALGCRAVLKNDPSEKYRGGPYTLTDGICGSENFHDGKWLGFEAKDFETLIDLGMEQKISSVRLNFLVDVASYIFPPLLISIYTSADGHNYEQCACIKPPATDPKKLKAKTEIISFTSGKISRTARYVKVVAKNQKTNPPWHHAPGRKSWLFVDEVECRK